ADRQRRAAPPIGVAARARLAGASSSRFALYGELGDALRATRRALQGFASIDDRRNAAAQRLDLGVMLLRIGDHHHGEAEIRQAIDELQGLGLGSNAAVGRVWLGVAALRSGRPAQAQALLEGAIAELADTGVALTRSWALAALISLHLRAGAAAEADAYLQQLQAIVRSAPPMWSQAAALGAEVRLAQGRLAEALDAAKNALQIWREGVPSAERAVRGLVVLAEVQAACGHRDEARAAADQGLAMAAQIRRSLQDPQLEDCFDASDEVVRLHRVAARMLSIT
ncbi:MAG: hypothetical protein HY902_02020, partial [Deltaproteobacteria bacterium]|nr:hypothetical protein [Deltaproteobacteria bacterium]